MLHDSVRQKKDLKKKIVVYNSIFLDFFFAMPSYFVYFFFHKIRFYTHDIDETENRVSIIKRLIRTVDRRSTSLTVNGQKVIKSQIQ